jgi:cardiolipin synthase
LESIVTTIDLLEAPALLVGQLAALGFSIFTAGYALLHKRHPRSAAIWVVLCLVLPVLGAIAFWLFGFNRVQTQAQVLRKRWRMEPAPPQDKPFADVPDSDLDPIPERFRESSGIGYRVTGRPLLAGNRVRMLRDGDEAYPVMLAAIRGAVQSISLSTYIFDRDKVGIEFVAALGDAVDRGVDVRVLIDGLGEWYSPRRIGTLLVQRGIAVERFLAPSILPPSLHINLRYHRKLLLVDQTVGFTGGMNIGQRHMVAGRGRGRGTRDLHFEVRGPILAEMQVTFSEDWSFVCGTGGVAARPISIEACGTGPAYVRAINTGPNQDLENLRWILLASLSRAKQSIRIMTPYFIAEPSLVAALNAAALRGVEVTLILPVHNNLTYMTWAARSQLWQLLEFGVRVFEQAGVFSHTKLVLIDDDYAVIGSSNLDPRSLRLNFEFNLEVCGGDCPAELKRHFETALEESAALELEHLEGRPIWMRLRDAFAALFSPYL